MMTTELQTDVRGGCSVQRMVGRHSWALLINGDCLDVLPTLPVCDLLLTDPPYGKGYHSGGVSALASDKWKRPGDDKWRGMKIAGDNAPDTSCLPMMAEKLKVGGAAYIYSQWMVEDEWADAIGASALTLRGRIVWVKPFHGAGDLKTTYGPQHETVLYATNGRHELRGRRDGDVWIERVGVNGCFRKGLLHPCEKPVPMLAWLIEKSTGEGETVLDPYMGSASTGIACLKTKRNFIGIERDAAHYKTACDRIAHELDGALL